MRYNILLIAILTLSPRCGGEEKVLINKLNDYMVESIAKVDTSKDSRIKDCDIEEINYIIANAKYFIYDRRSYWSIIDSLGITNVSNTDTLFILEQLSSGEVETYHSIVYKSNQTAVIGCSFTIAAGSLSYVESINNRFRLNKRISVFKKSMPVILTRYFMGQTSIFFVCKDIMIKI
jgi:hypothetical protein